MVLVLLSKLTDLSSLNACIPFKSTVYGFTFCVKAANVQERIMRREKYFFYTVFPCAFVKQFHEKPLLFRLHKSIAKVL